MFNKQLSIVKTAIIQQYVNLTIQPFNNSSIQQ
jgi:hypothetical protein